MKPPTELTITIPASIMAVPDLNLVERVILSRIHERPLCSNDALANLTSLTERGVESTLARLKKEGLIRSKGHGQSRQLFLKFHVEHHIRCGQPTNAECHMECGRNQNGNTHTECGLFANAECHSNGTIQPEEVALDLPNFVAKEAHALDHCNLAGNFNQARKHLDRIRRRFVALFEKSPEKLEQTEEYLFVFDHMIVVLEACWPRLSRLPGFERERLIGLLFKASSERLAGFRQQAEAAKASGEHVDLKLLIGD